MEDVITFSSLITPGGTVIAGGIITGVVELIKNVVPEMDKRFSGALQAFVLSGLLYLLAGIATGGTTLDAGLVVFLAWLSCATSAVGIRSAASHVQEVTSK